MRTPRLPPYSKSRGLRVAQRLYCSWFFSHY